VTDRSLALTIAARSLRIAGVRVLRTTVSTREDGRSPISFVIDAPYAGDAEWRTARTPPDFSFRRLAESRFQVEAALPRAVRCHGLGERYGALNLRGRSHTLVCTDDHRHVESIDSMYKAIPLLLLVQGSSCTGLFVDSPAPTRWDLDVAGDERLLIDVLTRRGFDFYVMGPATPAAVLNAYISLTGRPPQPPLWSLGHQQSRYSYETADEVRSIARELRQRRLPCDAIVLDIHYMDDGRPFTIDRQRFPNFAALAIELRELGLKLVPIVNPALKHDPEDATFRDGETRGVFCRRPDGSCKVGELRPGPCALPDFLLPEARRWWGQLHRFLTDLGVGGIWNDMNEPALFDFTRPLAAGAVELPADDEQRFLQIAPEHAVGHLEVRNLYGTQMCRATWEGLRQLRPEERPFVLTRAGGAGMQRYGATWLGDNHSWFEHLAASIPMLLNLALSGVSFAGVDVGGFQGDATGELLARWYQLGVFYPFFRNHCSYGDRNQEPWQFGPRYEAAIRRMLETRYRLLPYLRTCFYEYARSGTPILRPLWWHHPADTNVADIEDQFFFGTDILVAPILQRAASRRPVYLPAGKWYPFDGGTPLRGGRWHTIEWPIDAVPAFVRSGAILPLAAPTQSTSELERADLFLHFYGSTAAGTLYEDDGVSFGYENGAFNSWQLRWSRGRFAASATHRGYATPSRRLYAVVGGRARRVVLE
jgi:alpha-glucosidase